jgi:hypothetical protein
LSLLYDNSSDAGFAVSAMELPPIVPVNLLLRQPLVIQVT